VLTTIFDTAAPGSVAVFVSVVTMFVDASVTMAVAVTDCGEAVELDTTEVTWRLAELELTFVVLR
jgi:hypothetical protein